MNRVTRKPIIPNRSEINRSVQLQKMARSLKFQIKDLEEEGLYYLFI